MFLLILFGLNTFINAQKMQIKGKVTFCEGKPFQGFAVVRAGTFTDNDGKYTIEVSEGVAMVCSFV